MMKKIFILLLTLLACRSSLADTCPAVGSFTFSAPPPGWTFLVLPIEPSIGMENYSFSSAIHSLNGTFYYKQVICRYDVCPSFLCPAFTLISNKTYEQPGEVRAPWNHRSVIAFTLTCMPGDHDPAHCVFQ